MLSAVIGFFQIKIGRILGVMAILVPLNLLVYILHTADFVY